MSEEKCEFCGATADAPCLVLEARLKEKNKVSTTLANADEIHRGEW